MPCLTSHFLSTELLSGRIRLEQKEKDWDPLLTPGQLLSLLMDEDFSSRLVAGGGKWFEECCTCFQEHWQILQAYANQPTLLGCYCSSCWQQVNGLVLGLDHRINFSVEESVLGDH